MFPLSHILCISLTLPAKMFTKYGASLNPKHLASKRHVHQRGTQVPYQILCSPSEYTAPRTNNAHEELKEKGNCQAQRFCDDTPQPS